MGCAQGKCCLPRHPRRGSSSAVGGGATLGRAAVPGAGLVLEYAALAVAGLYPDSPARESQDAHLVATRFAGDPDLHLFAVFDGHGAAGAACAGFARDALPRLLLASPSLAAAGAADPAAAFREAMLGANAEMHAAPGVDDSTSGTTAVAALVAGGALHVANVGDSRAVAGVEGMRDPEAEGWAPDEGGSTPRLGARRLYPAPPPSPAACGDLAAWPSRGVAEPEVKSVEITPSHLFFVVASDGVFEFLSSQEVVDRVATYQDPRDACSAIAAESYKLWLEHENRTDDITIIIVHIRDMENSGPAGSDKADYGSVGESIAVHTIQSEIPVFVQSEASHMNRSAATGMQSPSSGSPTEQSLSCVAPSPTHPLLIHGRISDASKPVQICKLNFDKKRPRNNPPPSSGATNRTMHVMFASSKSRVVARVLVEHLLLPTMQGF
ncbi:unnamed protein product [Miscanthus lutarioriparius]|uniref:protein-serine/threonine phosphatase n=1 Tax=Miscanthus lutarioriparius TaxID=422564 RepID=A0A811N1Q3_9POAL|nr:unnamed protein product [Miscanthus lutarioriparius]